MNKLLPLSCFLLLLSTAQASHGDENFLRLGVGALGLNMQFNQPALNLGHTESPTLFAEFASSNYTATRLMAYRFHQQDLKMQGVETQLLWGYGLASQGLRIYTGPTAHIEHMHFPTSKQSHHRKAFAWQAGLGWQYKNFALDYSIGLRDNKPYNKVMKPLGYQVENVFLHSFLLSFKL